MLDVFNREVIGWPLKPRMTIDIVTGCFNDGMFSPSAASRRDTSFRSWQSICQQCVPEQAQGIRHGLLHVPRRKLLRYSVYDDGELISEGSS